MNEMSKELKFKGRLTKDDLINFKLEVLKLGYLSRTSIIFLIIIGLAAIFFIAGYFIYRYTLYYPIKIYLLELLPLILSIIYRKELILWAYKRYLLAITKSQEEDTEVVLNRQEIAVTNGSNPTRKYPSETIFYLKFPMGFYLHLDDHALPIILPNRILSENDVLSIQSMYVSATEKNKTPSSKK